MTGQKTHGLDISDYTLADYSKGIIIIMKDGELRYMAMPETIIQMSREHEDMAKYLAGEET